MMYSCQHCGEPGISKLRKLFMGPALPHTCRSCGEKTGLPYYSVLVMVPPTACLGLMMAWPMPENTWPVLAFVVALVTMPFALDRVPLVKR